ncbi:hypothetical protein V5799_027094 [Amblyomma americanum]|uniref:Uncharacterized protein n=1 Tax=Amblyomma americanum TaxID=6943 RepID=A0AAQ4DGP9_AMBAM
MAQGDINFELVVVLLAMVRCILSQAFPNHATLNQQKEFVTEILSSLREHLLAADVLLDDQTALPITAGGKYSNIPPNVFYLTSCFVDKLWQGMHVQTENVYRSLNRTLLFILSRPTECVADQMTKLECLQKMIIHRTLMLVAANSEADFIPCLCYCLLQLTADAQISMETVRRTTWHINPASFSDRSRNIADNKSLSSSEEGHLLVASAACKVWEIVYLSKRQSQQHLQKDVFEDWLQTETELTQERGLWGPVEGSLLDKWMLDMTEAGPCRMRKKMVKNDLFYLHYPYRPDVEGGENRALKYKVATSFDSKEYYKHCRPDSLVEHDTFSPDVISITSEDWPQEGDSAEEREIGLY